jgi:DNA-binding transcriptional ArsR family regulator
MVELQDDRLNGLFQALASPARRRIVSMLSEGPRNITEMVPSFDMSFAAVAKHVKMLESAGIVKRRIVGRVHVCSLEPTALRDAHAWLDGYTRFWSERLDALDRILSKVEQDDHPAKQR